MKQNTGNVINVGKFTLGNELIQLSSEQTEERRNDKTEIYNEKY